MTTEKITPVLEGKKIKDSEGNVFRVDFVDVSRQAISLWAPHGEKEICFSDFKFYTEA